MPSYVTHIFLWLLGRFFNCSNCVLLFNRWALVNYLIQRTLEMET